MKKLFSILLTLISFTGYAQMNTFGGIGLRVNDSTTYRANAASYHSAGYRDIYFNNQATTKHWDIWNGAAYEHVFTFNGGGGGGGGGTAAWGDITGTLADQTDLDNRLDAIESDVAALPAASVVVTPSGSISSTNAGAALNELDDEKAPYRKLTVGSVFTNQPAYSASSGYYNFYPETSGQVPRVYFGGNTLSTNGTKWKLEGFHTGYLDGSTTNYSGFNIFGETISGTHYTWIGHNIGGSGTRGHVIWGHFTGSSQEPNTSEIRMTATNTLNMRGNNFNYEALNGTDWFGINSSGAVLFSNGAGNSGEVPISQGSSSPTIWGVYSGSLNSTTTSTSGGTITLDMNSQTQRIHVASASISGPKTIAMSNATNALVFAFTIQITNVAGVLTMPANWVMSSINFDGTAWTPPSTGYFKFAGTYDGANWFVNVSGPYQ